MNLIWPKFHDADFRPDLKTNVRLHFHANLAMLRSGRDTGLFLLISLVPIGVVLTGLFFFPITISGTSGPTAAIIILFLLGLLVFYFFQHLAFMIAIEKTYTRHVRRAIRRSGTPICMVCGQLLHGNDVACSECGFHDGPDA